MGMVVVEEDIDANFHTSQMVPKHSGAGRYISGWSNRRKMRYQLRLNELVASTHNPISQHFEKLAVGRWSIPGSIFGGLK